MSTNKYCKECRTKILGEMIIVEELPFCSKECKITFIERISDELHLESMDINEIEINHAEELEREKKASYESGYEEGYLLGFLDSERKHKLCPVCNEREVNSIHHILPRKFGGNTNYYNIICLCNVCHDIIETETYELLKKNKFVSTNTLRHYILNGFPLLYSKKNNTSEMLRISNGESKTNGR